MVSNADVIRTLERVADLLEITGENIYKVRAYRTAAVQVENLGEPLAEIAAGEGLLSLGGFGPAIADKVSELLATGRLGFLEELESQVPPTLLSICELPGVGPRTVALLWREAGITTVDQLEAAARSGGLAGVPRLGARTIERLVAALDARRDHGVATRRPRAEVEHLALMLGDALRALPEAEQVEVAGSFRRGRDSVGDLDLVVATRDPAHVLVTFAALPKVEKVLLRGDTKCSIHASDGFQVDCRAVAPEEFGSALQYFTGAQAHNVRLRGRALRMGLTLNEYGLFSIADGERVAGETEEGIYEALGLRWIPPELREDRGEIDDAVIVALDVMGKPARTRERA